MVYDIKKRQGYKRLFANFDVNKVALFNEDDVERLIQDSSIIRNKLKIKAAINNAQRFIEVQKEFGTFCKYLWAFVDNTPIINDIECADDYVATSPISDALAKDLKKRGFKFLGSTTLYSHLQATGLINDHLNQCYRKTKVQTLIKP